MLLNITLALSAVFTAATAAANNGTNGIGSTPAQRHYVSASQASSIIDAAVAAAGSIVPENCAVTDPSGLLVAFKRMDNAYPGSIDISIKKARTVVLLNGMPTSEVYNLTQPGGAFWGVEETNGGLIAFGGGLALYKDGYLLGAIGCSGGSADQDVEVAQAGVDWLTSS